MGSLQAGLISHKMKTLAVERSFKLLSSSIHNWPTKLSKFKSVVTLKQMCILHPFINRKFDFYAVTMLRSADGAAYV